MGCARLARCLVCVVVGSLAFTSSVYAQRAKTIVPDLNEEGRRGDIARMSQMKAQEKFDNADKDKDGRLSKDEVVAAGMEYMAETFEPHDKNKDGFLSWEEYVGHDRWKR